MENVLDRLLKIKPVDRQIYGYDKNNKPNEYCIWDDYFNHWVENDLHYRERLINKKEGN